jgi:hypothetical protein
MSEADHRANLEVCRRMAAKASDELEKRAWLDMAESWRLLIITGNQRSTSEDYNTPSPGGSDVIYITSLRRWLMQQAGRYVPERQMLREKAASFLECFLRITKSGAHAPAWQAAPRRKFSSSFLGNTLTNAAHRTLARRRA